MTIEDVAARAECTVAQLRDWIQKQGLMPGPRRVHHRKRGASYSWEQRHVQYASIIAAVTRAGGTLEDAAFLLFLHDLPIPVTSWVRRALIAHVKRTAAGAGLRDGQSRTVEAVTARAVRAAVPPGLARLAAGVFHTRGDINESKLPALAPCLDAKTLAAADDRLVSLATEDARRMLAARKNNAYRELRAYMEQHRPPWYDHPYDDADMVATLLADWPYRRDVTWQQALLPLFTVASLAFRLGLVAPESSTYTLLRLRSA